MAIMDGKKFDGIQLGKKLDKCCVCERALIQNPDREIPYLEYEEVFKVKIGGIDYCICMDHFKEMVNRGHYMLIDTNQYTIVPNEILNTEGKEEPEKAEEVVPEEKPKKSSNKKKKEEGDK